MKALAAATAGSRFWRLAIAGLALASGSAAMAGPSKNADALQKFVDTVDTLAADFTQVQRDEKGAVTQTSSGKLWLARPGKFRWAYEKPYAQLMVCDGKVLWMYDPDLAQVTRREAGASLQGTPVQLLTDRAALEKQFKIADRGADGALRKLALTPRAADSDFQSVELWLAEGVPQRMTFHDRLGGSSEVSFAAIKVNEKPDAALFTFVPPKGVEVIAP